MAFSARNDAAPISGINVTPLVDVLLVLLIIFMISAPVVAHKARVDLPAPGSSTDLEPDPARVAIDADGSIFWNGTLVTDAALERQIDIAAASPQPPRLVIAAADNASYEDVTKVLTEAKLRGLTKIDFGSRQATD